MKRAIILGTIAGLSMGLGLSALVALAAAVILLEILQPVADA